MVSVLDLTPAELQTTKTHKKWKSSVSQSKGELRYICCDLKWNPQSVHGDLSVPNTQKRQEKTLSNTIQKK